MKNLEGIEVYAYQIEWNTVDYDIPASKFTRVLEEIYWYGVPGFELLNVVSYDEHMTIYLTSPNKYFVLDWMQVASMMVEADMKSLFVGLHKAVPNDAGVNLLTNLAF